MDLGFATTEEDFRSSETSNIIQRMMFEPGRALFTRKRVSFRIPFFVQNKSARRDSNPRPRPWQGRAPPTEPLAHFLCCRSPQRQVILYMMFSDLSTLFKKNLRHFSFSKNASNHRFTNVYSDIFQYHQLPPVRLLHRLLP